MKHFFLVVLLCAFGYAQKKDVKPEPPPAPPVIEMPLEDRGPLRELQLQWDELELENQRKVVEIEKNHQKQQQIMDQLKVAVIKYAQKKQINLDLYELDPKDLKFNKHK